VDALILQLRAVISADPAALGRIKQELQPHAPVETELAAIRIPAPSPWSALFAAWARADLMLAEWPKKKPKPLRLDLMIALLEDGFASADLPNVRGEHTDKAAIRQAMGEALVLAYAFEASGAFSTAVSDKFEARLERRRMIRETSAAVARYGALPRT
jgi:hypothetical protein